MVQYYNFDILQIEEEKKSCKSYHVYEVESIKLTYELKFVS